LSDYLFGATVPYFVTLALQTLTRVFTDIEGIFQAFAKLIKDCGKEVGPI